MVASNTEASVNHTSWLSSHSAMILNHTHSLTNIINTQRFYGKQIQALSTAMTNETTEIALLKKATSQLDTKQVIKTSYYQIPMMHNSVVSLILFVFEGIVLFGSYVYVGRGEGRPVCV